MQFRGQHRKTILYLTLALLTVLSSLWAQGVTGRLAPKTVSGIQPLELSGPDLYISKSHQGTFAVGQTGATYLINVRNIGTSPTTEPVTVTENLPPGLIATSIAGEGWTCVQPSGPCTQTEVLNPRGSYPPLILTVDVAPQPGGAVINRVTVSGGGDSNTGNNTAEDHTDIIVKGPDFRISKSHTGDFVRGQTGVTYTILVDNVGEGPSAGIVDVTDVFPAGLIPVSMNGPGWICTQPAGPCSRGDSLLNGYGYPAITVVVDVANNAPGTVTNVAKVLGAGDANPANDTANDLTSILVNGVDIIVEKSHSGNFKQNQTAASYTITVRNNGTQPSSGVITVADILPAGLTATSINGNGWTCTQPSGPCTRSDVLGAKSAFPPLTLTVNVAHNANPELINTATVSGGNDADPTNNTASDPTVIEGDTTCTVLPESPHPYPNNYDFTWTCSVLSPANATSVHVTFDALTSVQAGDFIHISDVSGAPIPGSPFTGTSLAGQTKIVPGKTVNIRLVTNASIQDYGLKVTNIIGVGADGADLTITKTHGGIFFRPQIGAQYTITVRNIGAGPTAGEVSVIDTVPAGLNATNISGDGWTCTQPAGPCTRNDALNPNSNYPALTLTVNVAANAADTVTNNAAVSGGGDTTPNNNTVADPTQTSQAQIVCNPAGLPQSGHPYDNDLNQTFTCSVQGNPSSVEVVFDPQTLLLDGDVLYIQDKNGNNIPGSPFTGSSLAGATKTVPGDTVKLIFVTDSRRTEWGFRVTSIAGVGSSDPDLTITKTHTGNFTQGQNGATYSIVVRNNGGAASNGLVTVTDNVPAGLIATSIAGNGWTCTQPAGPCTRNDSLFSGGAYPPLTLTVNVQPTAPGTVTNIATVAGGGDANNANNNASDPTTITPAGGGSGSCVAESAHPYDNDFDFTWVCTISGNPSSLNVTFDALTSIDLTDQLFVMTGAGVNIAGSPFTGQTLAGLTVNVPGNTVRIRLLTDSRRTDWGFKVTSVTPVP